MAGDETVGALGRARTRASAHAYDFLRDEPSDRLPAELRELLETACVVISQLVVVETERVNAAIVPLGGQLIASGGVGTATHVTHLATIPALHGCIIGKALYDKTLSLPAVKMALSVES